MKNAILAVILLCSLGLISGCRQQPFAGRHITVVMKKYSFDPPVIHIKNGETVALDVSTADVQHGAGLVDVGVARARVYLLPRRRLAIDAKGTLQRRPRQELPARGEARVEAPQLLDQPLDLLGLRIREGLGEDGQPHRVHEVRELVLQLRGDIFGDQRHGNTIRPHTQVGNQVHGRTPWRKS